MTARTNDDGNGRLHLESEAAVLHKKENHRRTTGRKQRPSCVCVCVCVCVCKKQPPQNGSGPEKEKPNSLRVISQHPWSASQDEGGGTKGKGV